MDMQVGAWPLHVLLPGAVLNFQIQVQFSITFPNFQIQVQFSNKPPNFQSRLNLKQLNINLKIIHDFHIQAPIFWMFIEGIYLYSKVSQEVVILKFS